MKPAQEPTKFPSAWYDDFELRNRGVFVKTAGTIIPFRFWVAQDVLTGAPFFLYTKLKQLMNVFTSEKLLRVYFTPHVPRPWYFVWAVAAFAKVRITPDKDEADAVFYFDDKTYLEYKQVFTPPLTKHINLNCIDISKSRVAKANQTVFNYSLAVNPETYQGKIVRKSETNAAHDGVILDGPVKREEGFSYQRLIDNTDGKHVVDLRCPTVGGEVEVVIIKKRPVKSRFANTNSKATYMMPNKVFSGLELALIKEYCLEMNLDWGSLDILRDNQTKEIYIVDVNKTEMGPPLVMKLKDKIHVTEILAKQLRAYIEQV